MYLIKTPWLLKKLYPQLTWDIKPAGRCIYLTFDDGPIPIVTPFVLNILRQYNAKATFFCIGDNIRKHPDVFEQVKADGHAIGNHTYNHLKGWETDDKAYLDNFLLADELIDSNLFRPPYGRIRRSQAKLLRSFKFDLKLIMWNVLSGDFDTNLSPETCLANVIDNTTSGDIVLFHDSLKAFERLEYALPKAMEYWSKEGYEFKSLADLSKGFTKLNATQYYKKPTKYGGMTVNERLYVSGLSDQFYKCVEEKNAEKAILILKQVELSDPNITAILKSLNLS